MKELQPLNQNVLLEIIEENGEAKTAGGLYIPDTAKEKPQYAKVVGIGDIENPAISMGDIVFYKKYSGMEIDFEGKTFVMLPYADLFAKVIETEKI